jgi:molybdopterin converting factor small subunit
MPRIVFTANLQRHVAAPECEVAADTVGAALHEVFAGHRALRGYVLDEQGHLRKHVFVFVDGVRIRDRRGLSDAVRPDSAIHVMQALTGG